MIYISYNRHRAVGSQQVGLQLVSAWKFSNGHIHKCCVSVFLFKINCSELKL